MPIADPEANDRFWGEFFCLKLPWPGEVEDDESIEVCDVQKAFISKQGSDGMTVGETWGKVGISRATYFNWKKKYGGLLPTEMRRLKQARG